MSTSDEETAVNEIMLHSPDLRAELAHRHERVRRDVALSRAGRRPRPHRPLTRSIAGIAAALRVRPRHRAA